MSASRGLPYAGEAKRTESGPWDSSCSTSQKTLFLYHGGGGADEENDHIFHLAISQPNMYMVFMRV